MIGQNKIIFIDSNNDNLLCPNKKHKVSYVNVITAPIKRYSPI